MTLFLNEFYYTNNNLYDTILKIIDYNFQNKNVNLLNFLNFMNKNISIIDNIFLSDKNKLFLKNYINNVLRVLYLRFKYIYKWKIFIKNKYINNKINNIDLCFNNIKSDDCIYYYSNKKVYLFSCNDLINIFKVPLSNRKEEYPLPNKIKNPYTNENINKNSMFYIYSQLKKIINLDNNNLIYLFMKSDFDTELFLEKNYNFLLSKSIKSYYENVNNYYKLELFLEFMNYYDNKINCRHFLNNENCYDIINKYKFFICTFKYINILLNKNYYNNEIVSDNLKLFKISKEIYNRHNKLFYVNYKKNII